MTTHSNQRAMFTKKINSSNIIRRDPSLSTLSEKPLITSNNAQVSSLKTAHGNYDNGIQQQAATRSNIFLNYLTSFSKRKHQQLKSQSDNKSEKIIKQILDNNKNISSSFQNAQNVFANNASYISTNDGNNKEPRSSENKFNLVKSLIKKHELENHNHITAEKRNSLPQRELTASQISIQNKMTKFDQKSEIFLRKNLEIIGNTDNWTVENNNLNPDLTNSFNMSPSSSSNSSNNSCSNSMNFNDSQNTFTFSNNKYQGHSEQESFAMLAFDNLTYSSSIDDLDKDHSEFTYLNNRSHENNEKNTEDSNQNCQNQPISSNVLSQNINKKNLKSIKRKDRMKKRVDEHTTHENDFGQSSALAQSMPDLNQVEQIPLISNTEYDKRLRKKFRSKALTRSLRRAKSIYYCNMRSKSLEDLTADEKKLFKAGSNISLCYLAQKPKLSRGSRLNCHSSIESGISALASDISSSYFHELSDWSPDFSSCESDSSDDNDIYQNLDWQKNFSNLSMSGFNTEYEDSDDENDEPVFRQKRVFIENPENKQLHVKNESGYSKINEMIYQKANNENEQKMNISKINSEYFQNPTYDEPTKGTIQDSVKKSETEFIEDRTLSPCAFCSTPFNMNDNISSLDCEHKFHENCLKVWLAKSSGCPLCKNNTISRLGFKENQSLTKLETLI